MTTRIQLRRDNAANWEAVNPVLADGEPGWDRTNQEIRIGDGVAPWNELDPINGGDGGGGGNPNPGTIRLTYRGTTYWPSSLADGDAYAHPDDSTLFLPNRDLDGFELGDFLDEFVKAGTTFLITETGDKNRWAHFEATGTPSIQTWGRNIPTNRIGGKFAIREGQEVSVVIDLAHAAAVRIGAGTDLMSSVATELRNELEKERQQRELLEFQLRSVFSVLSKTAQNKLRGVFPEGSNSTPPEGQVADGGGF